KYFTKIDTDKYQVIERIRSEVVYKQFNLMDKITYKKPYDLISCRNVMIYFDIETKNALIERLYDATKPGGYFFIGHAENVAKTSRYEFIKPAIFRRPL
ncbi:MAG TPA: CheR family methyltransferase, partial [Oscillospiraceae bacterium]|nr:CheR family methyltransferase [Oscillospiraceae bacterium]